MTASEHFDYDIVVVGGGIAGLAIAERLSREATRQNVRLSVLVVEKNHEFGAESSAGLEGWLHSGFLYAKAENLTTFNHCVNSLVDLITFYRLDPKFKARGDCNLDILPDERTPFVDRVHLHRPTLCEASGPRPWFQLTQGASVAASYLHYVYRRTPLRLRRGATVEISDEFTWRRQREDVFSRLDAIFWRANWLRHDGLCRAPSVASQSYRVARSVDFFLPDPGVSAELQRVLGDADDYDIISSRDVVINTRNVLSDLLSASAARGVHFRPDSEVTIYGDGARIGCRADGQPMTARLFILACGMSLAQVCGGPTALINLHPLGLDIAVRNSTMAVLEPPLVHGSFVRVDLFRSQEFNHLLRICPFGHAYAIIADGNGRAGSARDRNAFDPLALEAFEEKARLYGRAHDDFVAFACNKVEAIARDDRRVGYDYFIEPAIRYEWSDAEQKAWFDWTRDQIRAPNSKPKPPIYPDRAKSNYLVVLPGKFTLFPTVAEQAYLEAEARGLFAKFQQSTLVGSPSESRSLDVANLFADRLCPRCRLQA